MENKKPILATNLDGFLIEHTAFIEPHKIWFDRVILLTKDNSLSKWKGHKEYFSGVDKAMEKIMPNSTKEKRTSKAREWYQEDVVHYISIHPELINLKLKKELKKLKKKYILALITTNTKEHINQILKAANLKNIYDIILASDSEKEPKKEEVFQKFKEKYGKPRYYLASRNKEAFEQCKKIGSLCIYFSSNPELEIQKIAHKTLTSEKALIKILN
jgi:FMN phosphatase YigB (HAD superfamily)